LNSEHTIPQEILKMAEQAGGTAAGAGAGAGAGEGGGAGGAANGAQGAGAGQGPANGNAGAGGGAAAPSASASGQESGAGKVEQFSREYVTELRGEAGQYRTAATTAREEATKEKQRADAAEAQVKSFNLEKSIGTYNTTKEAVKVDATLATTLLTSPASGIEIEYDDKGQIKDIAKVMKDLIAKFPNVVGQADTQAAGGQGKTNLSVEQQIDAIYKASGGNSGNGFRI
jgi:hypothetical protein